MIERLVSEIRQHEERLGKAAAEAAQSLAECSDEDVVSAFRQLGSRMKKSIAKLSEESDACELEKEVQ